MHRHPTRGVAAVRALFLAAAAWGGVCAATPAAATGPSAAIQCRSIGLPVCPAPFDGALPPAKDMLTWDRHDRIIGFRNTYRLYPADVFHTRGGPPFPLPPAAAPLPAVRYTMDGTSLGLDEYLHRQRVTGLLILQDGHVAYEYYGSGNPDTTLWTSRSVAKSVVSILVGIAIREQLIASVSDPVTRYLPELKGTDWDGVTLRDLLQHVSGMKWNERYADPDSDFAQLTRCEAAPDAYRYAPLDSNAGAQARRQAPANCGPTTPAVRGWWAGCWKRPQA